MQRSIILPFTFVLAICLTAALLLWNKRCAPVRCPRVTSANVTDRLDKLWVRSAGNGLHSPISIRPELGTINQIDIYHNVSNVPGKSTVLFAYRDSSCTDWNRQNPERLFANEIMDRILSKGGVYVDVGACYGDTSVPLAVHADMVIALEPNPFSYRVLEVNALLNPGLNIRTHNVAAGNGNVSELQFTYGEDMCNGGILGDWKDAKTETALHVQAVTLPKFLHEQYGEDVLRRITFIKVDAEGFDSDILGTLQPLLQYTKPLIWTEWFDYYVTSPPHGSEGPDEVHPGAQRLFSAINKLGYTPYNPATGERIPGPQNKHKIPDVLCRPS